MSKAPWPVPVPLQAIPLGSGGSIPPGSVLLGAVGRLSWDFHWEDHWKHLVGHSDLANNYLAGTSMGWVLRFLRQIGTGEEPGCNSICGSQYHGGGQVGPLTGSASMYTLIQCPQMLVLSCMLIVPNRRIVTLHVVWTCPLTSSRQNSLGAVVLDPGDGVASFPASQFLLEPLLGSWNDPDMTAPKWACFQVMVSLMSEFPFVIIPITLSMILDLTMTRSFLE